MRPARKAILHVVSLAALSTMFGCAGMEYNVKQDRYFHKELVTADLAVDAAQKAGKDRECPREFREAQNLKNKAYEVYAACHTEEGIRLANEATAKANALCPPRPAAVKKSEPVVIMAAEPKAVEKVQETVKAAAVEPKVVVLAFEDIHFDFDQSTLKPEAKRLLKRNIEILRENPNAKIRIAGYTSASGTTEYNQALSERRAQAVKAYLEEEGISRKLSTIGYGETQPATYETAPKELYSPAAKSNMRVLFEVVVE